MTATTAPRSALFDCVLMGHIGIAVASLVVVVVTYSAVLHLPKGTASAKQFFRPGAQWPLRIIHLLPVTGIALVLLSQHDVSFSEPFVGIGLAAWLAMSGILEALAMPAIRMTSQSESEGLGSDPRALRRIRVALDATTLLLIVAAIVMVAQPGS